MPVRLPIDPAITNGDAFGVDDNYQAYEEDPLTGEWIPPAELAQRQADRAAKAAQPPPPPTDADTPQTSPANPTISALPQDQADSMDKLSQATRNAYAPDASKDASLSEGEQEAQGLTNTTGGAAATTPAQTQGARPITAAVEQQRIDNYQRSQTASQAESEGQTAPGQTVPTDVQQQIATSGGADTSQTWADPYNVGAIYNGPTGMRPPQNEREMALAKGDISSSSNLLENKVGQAASAVYNANVPALEAVQQGVKDVGTAGLNAAAAAEPYTQGIPGVGEVTRAAQSIGQRGRQDVANFAASQVPTSVGNIVLTLAPFIGEGGRLLEGVSNTVRENLTKQALDAGYPDLESAIRDVVANGETGSARLPRPGGGTAREAALQHTVENRNLGGAVSGSDAGNRLMREAAPLTEEMATLGQGTQINPASVGLPEDKAALQSQAAALRRNSTGQTAELGRLDAQKEALDAIEGKDAAGAFQDIADRYASVKGTSPYFRAQRDEFGRIHAAMLDPEDPGRFAPEALTEPPAGATFDPITHEIQAPGANNLELSNQAPPAATTTAPVLGSMREEGFRGEQGGVQPGLGDLDASAGATRYQPGLGEGAAPANVSAEPQLGKPAADVNELDRLLATRAQNQAVGRNLPAIDQRIVELGKKTPYDDAGVIAARAENARMVVPETPEMHAQWTGTLYDQGGLAHPEPGEVVPIRHERKADIILGPPAAGKNSATANPLRKARGAMLIDADEAKEMIPGFAGGRFAGPVHLESDKVAGALLDRSMDTGDNMVLPMVGKNQDKIDKLGRELKDAGYEVRLHYVDLPESEAAGRAVDRFYRTGRFVDPDYVLNRVDGNPRRTFDALKGKDWVSGFERKTNDVPRGHAAVTVESSLEGPAAAPGANGPGVNDVGHVPSGAGGQEAARRTATESSAAGEPIPGLAESVANIDAVRARADAVRSGDVIAGTGRDVATAAGNGARSGPAAGLVTQADGKAVEATPAAVEDAVQRVLARQSGISIKQSGGDVREQLIQGLLNARTRGGRPLLQGVDKEVIEDALDNVMLDQNFRMSRSPGRGKFATTYQVGGAAQAPEAAASGGVSASGSRAAGQVDVNGNPVRGAAAQANASAADLQRRLARGASDPEAITGAARRDAQAQLAALQGEGGDIHRLVDEGSKLPRDLAGAQPRYREATPQFESDIDKAAYIAAQTTPSKRDAQYVKFVMDATGLDEQGVRDLGNQVRSAVKDAVENADDPLHPQVSQVFGAQPAEAAGAKVADTRPYNEIVGAMGKEEADRLIKARASGTGDTSMLEGGNGGEVPPGEGAAPTGGGEPPKPRFTHNVADKTYGFVGDLYNEFKGLIGAFPTLKTALHLPVLRQGYPYLILHPLDAMGITRDAIRSMASSPFAEEIMSKAEARVAISGDKAALREAGFKNMLSAKDAGLRISSYDVGATAEERESELQGLNASRISRGVERIPGILQTARGYTVETNLTRMHWYETVAQQMDKAGVTDPREYRALADTVNHWTQYGTGNLAKQGQIPFLFSQRAAVGRIQAVLDPLTQPGSLFHASARQEAAKALVAFVAANAALIGIAVESGAGKAVYQNANGLHVPTLRFGQTTVNPWAGFSGPVNLVMGLTQDAAKLARGQTANPLARVIEFVRSDLGPVPGKALDIASRTDYAGYPYNLKADLKSGQFAKDLALPLFAEAVWDAIKQNGPMSWNNLAALPSLGGMSASSYPPSLTQMRDQAAQAMGKQGAKDAKGNPLTSFANALPNDQQTINADPKIAEFTSRNQTAYQKASDAAHAPIIAEVQRNEDLFNQGMNTKKLSDVYHDEATANQQAAHDLTDQFASTFAGFNKTAYSKAVDGYYNTVVNVPAGQPNAGGYDPDATAAARADYLAKLPADQQQWLNASLQVTEGNKTELHQEYDKYIADKKAAGYFALDPKDPDYNAKKAALDKANPALDVASFKFNSVAGTGGGSLNSAAAVDQALALNRPNTPVKATLEGVGSLARPVNQSPEVQQAWEDSKAELAKYAAAKVANRAAEQAYLAQGNSANAADYKKPWDKLTKAEQTTVDGGLATAIRDGSPKMDALLAWWGVTSTLRTQAALVEYRKLQARYGKDKASPTQNVTLIAGAP